LDYKYFDQTNTGHTSVPVHIRMLLFLMSLTVTFVMTRSFQVQSAGEGRIMTYVKVDSLGYK